jgi:hypothetical protein
MFWIFQSKSGEIRIEYWRVCIKLTNSEIVDLFKYQADLKKIG